MKTLKDEVAEIASAARQRDDRAFSEAARQLDEAHRPSVYAHLAFAYLHMALVLTAAELVAGKVAAECIAVGADIHLRVVPRQVSCRFQLQATSIEVWFIGENGRGTYRPWTPPASTNPGDVYAAAQALAVEAAKFVTSLTHLPQ